MTAEEQSASIDPALAENLDELILMANEIGADSAWIVREGQNINLSLGPKVEWEPAHIKIGDADTGTLVVLHFPASDGHDVGLEECSVSSDA